MKHLKSVLFYLRTGNPNLHSIADDIIFHIRFEREVYEPLQNSSRTTVAAAAEAKRKTKVKNVPGREKTKAKADFRGLR